MILQSEILSNEFIKVTKTYYKDGVSMPPHSHDFTSISIVLNGQLQETVGNYSHSGGIAQTSIKPAGTIHENFFSKDCHILSIAIEEISILNKTSQDILKDWRWISNVDGIDFFLSILQCASGQDFIELINDWMQDLSVLLKGRQHYMIPAWLREVKEYLDHNYHEQLRSDGMAERFGFHRVYLARAFRKCYGVSIKEYLHAVRLHNAMGSIALKDQTMTETALENGFADQSHFNRKFKEKLELTPTEFRQLTS